LDEVCDIIKLSKDQSVLDALSALRAKYPQIKDFERDFPSLCFNIATGVGKTRLMGAFITYLYKVWGIRHFFVLAPNLTIYNKLVNDFTPNTPKYVLQGLSEFATNPPEVITGDNYESGRGVRDEARKQKRFDPDNDVIHINIFNISKINSEVRGGKAPRIKRLSEYIGQSYFDYLAGLDDLVLLMDESHRYRASAGLKAINELRPIIGLELTATAQIVSGKGTIPFKNILYQYPLAAAMKDGYVKEPAVATRRDFDAKKIAGDALDRMKLEDGLVIHENCKIKLEAYAAETGQKKVKPFALVVARDTTHADQLEAMICSDTFHGGRYKDKVLTIHTNLDTAEATESLEKLLSVERPDNPVEIVIHVNMLGEGWDVTNLYTIIPLRTADSQTLVEQSIGRGLRLPYGKRTGNPDVDRLTIVAHDRFQDIVDYAKREDSIIHKVFIGEDIPGGEQVKVEAQPKLQLALKGQGPAPCGIVFKDKAEQDIALAVNDVIENGVKGIGRNAEFASPEDRKTAISIIADMLPPGTTTKQVELVIPKVQKIREFLTIDVPQILMQPKGEVITEYKDFNLDASHINEKPVDEEILLQYLANDSQFTIRLEAAGLTEQRHEDYLVHGLIEFNDVNYDRDAKLLYKLSGQMVKHLRSYLKDDKELLNVLQYHRKTLVNTIHEQMATHFEYNATDWEIKVAEKSSTLTPRILGRDAKEAPRDFSKPVDDKRSITRLLFNGFTKCLFNDMKFQADTERIFAVILEHDATVLKWVKPSKKEFPIYYREGSYVPDFVVETDNVKYVCETKAANEMKTPAVLAKAQAVYEWCQYATEFEKRTKGKPWSYLLIPHDAINEGCSLKGLAAKYTYAGENIAKKKRMK
jgi:type III restriction enzyme